MNLKEFSTNLGRFGVYYMKFKVIEMANLDGRESQMLAIDVGGQLAESAEQAQHSRVV